MSFTWAVVSCKTEGGTGHFLTSLVTQLQTSCKTQRSIAPYQLRHCHHPTATVKNLYKFIESEEDKWVITAHDLQMACKELGFIKELRIHGRRDSQIFGLANKRQVLYVFNDNI